MNAEAGAKARWRGLKPFVLSDESQLWDMPPFPFPDLGNEAERLDKEHERVDSLFCDSSGLGSPSEPALTASQLVSRLQELLEEHGEILVAIELVGEFQLNLGVWKRKDEKAN